MTELFGERYFHFIASSYAVTAIVLLAMVAWVIVTYRARQATLAKLEAAGIRRASKEEQLQAAKKVRSQ
ncbi:MAG: heme exporter protein CcmD [Pseudomonadota bacterium]